MTNLQDIKQNYEHEGYVSGIEIVSEKEAALHRKAMEDTEAKIGPIHYKNKIHTILRSPLELTTHPKVLDVVEQLIGPNILLHNATYIVKEPHTPIPCKLASGFDLLGVQPR